MTRAKLVLSAERIGGAVASWLVPSGKEVREGQPILRYKAGSTEKEYLAPISGSLSWSTLLDGALDFCTHEELLSGKLCLRCGFDVSTLSRKAQELVAAHRSSTMQGYRMRGGTGHSITMSDARAREADVRKLVSTLMWTSGSLDASTSRTAFSLLMSALVLARSADATAVRQEADAGPGPRPHAPPRHARQPRACACGQPPTTARPARERGLHLQRRHAHNHRQAAAWCATVPISHG